MIKIFLTTRYVDFLVASLTPAQRWQGAKRLRADVDVVRWFVLIGGSALVILSILFLIITVLRYIESHKFSKELFGEYCTRRGLSTRECQLLFRIANLAGLKRSGAIFTMSRAFDRQIDKLIDESLSVHGEDVSKQLRIELSILREKLGFKIRSSSSIGSSASKSKKMSSRNIPIDKKFLMRSLAKPELGEIEADIVKSSSMELEIKVGDGAESKVGEKWCVRCNFGASIWEFDTAVVSCNGSNWSLRHSNNIRFINRRTFPRVPVNRPAFITRFPFIYAHSKDFKRVVGDNDTERELPVSVEFMKPEFSSAVITELAGPGLKIDTSLDLKVGEKVLVIFNLEEKQIRRTVLKSEGELTKKDQGEDKYRKVITVITQVVRDIAEVRFVRKVENGFSVALELTGLTDSDVNELVRVTNASAIKSNDEKKDVSDNEENKKDKESGVVEKKVAQEV
ncbi:MAG: hypothetical protein FVQ80_05895 [Planctomycetes bacterium]|nr:hypothetical protein [Planctomycetota bacterium]